MFADCGVARQKLLGSFDTIMRKKIPSNYWQECSNEVGSQSDSAGTFNVIAALQDSGIVKPLNCLVFLGKGRTSLHVYIDIKNRQGYEGGFQKQIVTLVERYSCYRAENYSKTFRFQFYVPSKCYLADITDNI